MRHNRLIFRTRRESHVMFAIRYIWEWLYEYLIGAAIGVGITMVICYASR
jgi:uncharacterized membrane protein